MSQGMARPPGQGRSHRARQRRWTALDGCQRRWTVSSLAGELALLPGELGLMERESAARLTEQERLENGSEKLRQEVEQTGVALAAAVAKWESCDAQLVICGPE